MIKMDVEELKKKKLQELMAQGQQSSDLKLREGQMKEELKKAMFNILDSKARERLNNIRVSKPDFAMEIELVLLLLAHSGQVNIPINEENFKNILNQLIPKKDWKIRRK
jgi:programmed cell death protein 5